VEEHWQAKGAVKPQRSKQRRPTRIELRALAGAPVSALATGGGANDKAGGKGSVELFVSWFGTTGQEGGGGMGPCENPINVTNENSEGNGGELIVRQHATSNRIGNAKTSFLSKGDHPPTGGKL